MINDNNEVGYRIRKLTPLECWRLMAFDDKDFYNAQNAGVSNSQLYKQAGNSIVVDVLYYIYRNMYQAMPYLFRDLKVSSFFSGIGAFEKALDKLYEDINSGAIGGSNCLGLVDCEQGKITRLGNIYGAQFGGSFGGNVWDKDGIMPTLKTTAASTQQHIIEDL